MLLSTPVLSLLLRTAAGIGAVVTTTLIAGEASPVASAVARREFLAPTVDHRPGVLWIWNDWLTEEQIRSTLRDLAAQGVMQPYVHPRPGLMTPYLSDAWFKLWNVALDEARRLGMKLWIYDENSYPSGFAGGWVPELMPESRGMGVAIAESAAVPPWNEDTVSIHRIDGDRLETITQQVRAGASRPSGRYITATLVRAEQKPWFAGRSYVNLLTPGVAQKFLEITFEPYRRRFGPEFGRHIPGAFTDEPQLRPSYCAPWCADLPARFEQRWGYDLLATLPSLAFEVGDWRRVRHNYFQLLNELFVERWAKPYYDYCDTNGLQATGHYWEHEWPGARSVPDNMTAAAWQHRPGIDVLENAYSTSVHAQFGNARAAREIASVASQLGRERTTCEVFGASGWDLRFADMKRIGDWLQALGVNSFVQHLSYVTIRGSRKRDHPPSFSYHEPWWQEYRTMADYFARLSAALSHGEQHNDILLLEPTTSGWMYNLGHDTSATLERLGQDFQNTVNTFEAAQVEYDIGSEYLLARQGAVKAGELVVGHRGYHVLVLPPHVENLNEPTITLIEQFMQSGGLVVSLDDTLQRVDGETNYRAVSLPWLPGWKRTDAASAARWLAARTADEFALRRTPGDEGIVFHQRRRFADGELLFLVNTSAEHTASGSLSASVKGVERWNAESGAIEPYPFSETRGGIEAEFSLPPCGSLLLFLSHEPRSPAPLLATPRAIVATGPLEITRLQPNVATLDFVDATAGRETRRNLYCYDTAQFVFQKNGVPRNPWESAVQFRDELISRTYPARSGFAATYRFVIESRVPASLSIVIERPDLYTITCNGQPVSPRKGEWWLDRAFGCIDLTPIARVGENTVTLQASPFTNFHELEPAYLRGDFRLKPVKNGFVLVPDTPLQLGAWNEQGCPFYSEGVAYRERFDVVSAAGKFVISLPHWQGSVARVKVNGDDAGIIGWPPWQCDVSRHIRAGENTIEVVVVGTLKNTLGPHHGSPPVGRGWPGTFRTAPKDGRAAGDDYATLGYGLFAPFVLLHTPAPDS